MQKSLLLFLLAIASVSSASESISDNFLIVQVEEYELDHVNKAVNSHNVIASWVVRKTEGMQYPFMCSTVLAGYLDSEKTKQQNISRMRKMLLESEGVTKLLSDSESIVNTLDLSREKIEQKIKNIEQFTYSVNCLEISPNSELNKYFSFGAE